MRIRSPSTINMNTPVIYYYVSKCDFDEMKNLENTFAFYPRAALP
jgi:hypothetical protein